MFCVVYKGIEDLQIIGEIQIQDHGLHMLKLKVILNTKAWNKHNI